MITPSFALTATERVLPRLALDWTTGLAQSGVDVVRAGVATFVGSNGYIQSATADTQRIDWSTGVSGLLVEEARTNLRSYSEAFDNGSVWFISNVSVSADFSGIISPSGTQTADKLIVNNGFTSGHIVSSLLLTSGTTYTYSCYAKAGERNVVRLRVIGTAGWISAIVNLTTGTVTSSTGTVVVTERQGGWYRIAVTAVCDKTGSNAVYIYDNSGVTGNGSDGFYIYGAQLEAGAFPTSYIPTEATAVTRNADVATMTGTNFSDWFNPSEGTFLAQASAFTVTGSRVLLDATDGTTAERMQMYGNAGGTATVFVADNGVTQAQFGNRALSANTTFQFAFGYKENSFATSVNAQAIETDATGTLPVLDRMTIGCRFDGTLLLNGHYKKLFYYPQRLVNAEIQAISKG